MLQISQVAEQLLTSQEGPILMELIKLNLYINATKEFTDVVSNII